MSNIEKTATFLYKMTLGDKILSEGETLTKLELEQGVAVTCIDSAKNLSYYVTLHGIKVNKKIYQPTEIEAELLLIIKTDATQGASKTTSPSFDAVSSILLQRQVKLEMFHVNRKKGTTETVDEGNGYLIAENCYVYELDPQLKRDANGTKMYVKLNIFSMDKLMTLNKYSKAYVARKLGSGILKPESINFGKAKNSDTPLINTNIKELRFLKYDDNVSYKGQDKKMHIATIPSEFIQPYLVQYNETFYDFLVRTANRCGEFLYFEDGALTLGLPDSGDPIVIDDFKSVTNQNYSADPMIISAHVRDSVKDGVGKVEKKKLNQSVIGKMSTGFPEDAFAENIVSNAELSNDEYIFPIVKDKFSDFARETYNDGNASEIIMSRVFPLVKTVLANEKAGGAGAGAVIGKEIFVTEGVLHVKAAFQVGTANDEGNSRFLDPYTDKVEQYGDDKFVQFSSLKEEGWTTIDYYNDIHKHESEQQRQIICIDMGTDYVDVKLGQKIKIEGLEGNYVVIQIQQVSEEAWDNNYDKYDANPSDKYAGNRSQKVYAIPSYLDADDDNKEKFIPPIQPVSVIRKSGPQTAFVTDNIDPKYQGRVRVAYPWQTLNGALKTELTQAEQRLEIAKEEKTQVENEMTTLPLLIAELNAELEQLNKYVKANAQDREKMLADLDAKRKQLETDIENLEADRFEKDPKLAKLEAEINAMKNNPNIEDSKVEQKKVELEVFRRDQMAAEIKEIDDKIAAKKKEIEKLDQQEADMKAAAKEYDKNKESSVIARKQKAYNEASNDYNNHKEKLAALEQKVKDAEAQKDKVKDIIDKTAKDMSTPWIRIASPMATPGGGVFFRPRVGDEVLVNFDCDNVERPYVVGSLFSKNTLTPDEGLYRKAAPEMQWKNLSMQIMSPNGHHITFTDPPGGGSFISNVISPGMGFYATVIPGLSTLNGMGEKYKDLAGGIHIGDRYGMYEIEMKSQKRSININSPFGSVGIDAFSGITINAPNGNINIKGKNITLEAGNKITMISGKNIEDPDIGDPEGTGNCIGKYITSITEGVLSEGVTPDFLASVVDFSLIRHVAEVFARPVDGTMLLKSKRYLKLEAGPGNATIKFDRYNKDLKAKKGAKERFFMCILDYIDEIIPIVDEFFDTYKALWSTGYTKRIPYYILANDYLSDADDPDIIELVKDKEWNDQIIKLDNFNNKFDSMKHTGETVQQKFDNIKDYATNYARAVHDIEAHVASLPTLFDDAPEIYFEDESMQECLKDALQSLYDDAPGKWKDDIETTDGLFVTTNPTNDDLFSEDNRKVFKRKIILGFIYEVARADFNAGNKYIEIDYKLDYIKNTHTFNQEYYWKRQVINMDHYWQRFKLWRAIEESTWGKIKSKFFSNFVPFDRDIWADKKDGQILFSDQADSTLNFDGEGLQEESNSNIGNLDYLKKILMGIN